MKLLAIFLFLFSVAARADVVIAPVVNISAPVFLGAGGKVVVNDTYELALSYGLIPQPFYSVIGQVAAYYGGNAAYRDVIEAGFQNNSVVRADLRYDFRTLGSGWITGLAFSHLSSNGRAGIDRVLAAANGRDYTNLKNLLIATGRSPDVDMNGTLSILELNGGYSWTFYDHLVITGVFGVAKVLTSDVALKSGLPNFEASNAGSQLMRQSESDIEAIIVSNGISPVLGMNAAWMF